MHKFTNHLIDETSPYLLLHAHNPVDWHPWNQEAIEKAKKENKPILLSIGYTACHWCHVMAEESFEDEETASLMNQEFVNIKVDREERPDLDKLYQLAYQLFTQRPGGWPLTVFLTPSNHMPIFVGTYFPKVRGHLPSFKEILLAVKNFYYQQKEELDHQNDQFLKIIHFLEQQNQSVGGELNLSPLSRARENLEKEFDWQNGGFGSAPKFPLASYLDRLINHGLSEHDQVAFKMAEFSLEKMAMGGIFDQLGGGFYRYCVDQKWQIPHFEKMLYDNAELLYLYAKMAMITKNRFFYTIAEQTAQWTIREMQTKEGGYCSSLAADSEGEEAKFYTWDLKEIKSILNQQELEIVTPYFGLDQPPNFENKWHLVIAQPIESNPTLTTAIQKLFQHRDHRVKPLRDEKILTAWNGLMIKAMAFAGEHMKNDSLIDSAQHAVDFIKKNLWQSQHLYASYKDGRLGVSAFLDDYAFLLDGVLSLLEAHWRSDDLLFAMQLAEQILDHFEDQQAGGFYFTSDDHEQLIYRSKEYRDEALPNSNAIVTGSLLKLGYLLGEKRYISAAERALKNAWPHIVSTPESCSTFLNALELYFQQPEIIILRGKLSAMRKWVQASENHYRPYRMIYAISDQEQKLPENLSQKISSKEAVIAYRCKGFQCDTSVTNLQEFINEL